MKRFTRSVCVILALVLLLSAPAYAASVVTPRGSSFFMSYDPFIYQETSTKLQIWFDVVAVRTMDELGVSYIELQRSPDGRNWTTVKTYDPEDYPQMICENTGFHMDCVTYNAEAGYYYRAREIFYAKNSTGIGELDDYTSIVMT